MNDALIPFFAHTDYTCVRINAPHFWDNPAFAEWAQRRDTARWNCLVGGTYNETDVFTTYSGPEEGSDYGVDGIPRDVWRELGDIVKKLTGSTNTECLLWISNIL